VDVFILLSIIMKLFKLNKDHILALTLVLAFEFCFPHISMAQEASQSASSNFFATSSFADIIKNDNLGLQANSQLINPESLPKSENRQPKKKIKVVITAYSSTVDQCDDTPFITANGHHVADGIIAANFLYFGTKVQIPSLFGEKIFSVEDRMNTRFSDRMDIWMPTREEAIAFGVKYVEVWVY